MHFFKFMRENVGEYEKSQTHIVNVYVYGWVFVIIMIIITLCSV